MQSCACLEEICYNKTASFRYFSDIFVLNSTGAFPVIDIYALKNKIHRLKEFFSPATTFRAKPVSFSI